MKYTTIRIEGAILSADILDKIEQGELGAQRAKDFGFDAKIKVKDEIARAWADAQDLWRIFKRQKEKIAGQGYGTTETRKFWMVPLLGLFGYDAQLSKAETVNGKSYAISHQVTNLGGFPVHIVGFNDSLDRKRKEGGTRMSPHALLQEYINLTENLYTIVTNGLHLRLLRDSSRLIKLSFIEFDLETMMDEEHFADFAIMYRLLHSSRMPVKIDLGADSLIEKYHQDALDSGSRIREGLSQAVESSIRSLANGFLKHSDNNELRDKIENSEILPKDFYHYQLRLIYRLLFLMVIEERSLVFPAGADKSKREIYYEFYSVNHLRKLCEKRYLADQRFSDLWIALKNTFYLFESETKGKHLGLKPLAGDLFGYHAIGILNNCNLDNQILLECLRNLNVFINKSTGQKMRVNYASLNVEEFGSVYEGLLEYEPVFAKQNGFYKLDLVKGTERSSSGSHYTPDELVQPLIKHSLDYVIKDKLESSDKISEKEKALLSIKVCDVACGSGHILLNAARRIGTDLARVRTGEDQPSPAPLRQAVRDVIKSCIYGVDKNPLAVELCKVALWLEAHNPGEPLNFLDHHIKCGDAIVGLAHKEELENGIADEAFKKMPEDDKAIRAELAKQNKRERNNRSQKHFDYDQTVEGSFKDISKMFEQFNRLPENTIEEIEYKRNEYATMTSGVNWMRLKRLADIQVAQFFIPKTEENVKKIITDEEYMDYFSGTKVEHGLKVGKAGGVAAGKRFFHWFLEFPVVFAGGGFDCILGNPPFLHGLKISENYGDNYNLYLVSRFAGGSKKTDLCAYFFRRNFEILNKEGLFGLISTNTISQGTTRKGGLDIIVNDFNGDIIHAYNSIPWPGKASVIISVVWISKCHWNEEKTLNNKRVEYISSLLKDADKGETQPLKLIANQKRCFQGSNPYSRGFVITEEYAIDQIEKNNDNREVIFPFIGGKELNSRLNYEPPRWIINFGEMDFDEAASFHEPFEHVELEVKPDRLTKDKVKYPRLYYEWWKFWHSRNALYNNIKKFKLINVLARSRVSNLHLIDFIDANWVFSEQLVIFLYETYSCFSILQSSIHQYWAEKYRSTMKSDTRYIVSDCFESFPFPQSIVAQAKDTLEQLGAEYQQYRRQLMIKIQLGLTKTYNQFHNPDLKEFSNEDTITIPTLKAREFQIQYGKKTVNLWKHLKKTDDVCTFNKAVHDIIKLRNLHKEMDGAVLNAYGWEDIDLAHDFYEVDYLPENDRVRFTISPEARKEILKRLLKLNHEIHEQEKKGDISPEGKTKKKKPRKIKNVDAPVQRSLF